MPPKHLRTRPDLDGLPSTDHMDRLCAAYERIAEELTLIRQAFDLLVDDIAWGLSNDKFKPDCFHNLAALAECQTGVPARESVQVAGDREDQRSSQEMP